MLLWDCARRILPWFATSFLICISLSTGSAYAGFNPFTHDWMAVEGREKANFFSSVDLEERHGFDTSLASVGKRTIPIGDKNIELYRITSAWSPSNLFFYYAGLADGKFIQLDGSSEKIYRLIENNNILISTDSSSEYLRFYSFFLRAAEGPFYIVESKTDSLVPKGIFDLPKGKYSLDEKHYSDIGEVPKPIQCRAIDQKNIVAECNVIVMYSNAMFDALLDVDAHGRVDMKSDVPVVADLPVKIFAPIEISELDASSKFQAKKLPSAQPQSSMLDIVGRLLSPDRSTARSSGASASAVSGGVSYGFQKLKSYFTKESTDYWEYIEGDSFVTVPLGDKRCYLYYLDDTRDYTVRIDGFLFVSVGAVDWGEKHYEGYLTNAGIKIADFEGFDSNVGTVSGLDNISAAPRFSIFERIAKVTQFWGQLYYGGGDISIYVSGRNVKKSVSPIYGAWANGTMKKCEDLYEK